MRTFRQFFEPHEDDLLRAVVDQLGTDNWRKVAANLPGRTARQCRERYNAYLCPTINSSPWTPEEDELLIAKFPHYGTRWAEYRPLFRHRTLACIRNRWYVLLRKQEQRSGKARRDRRTKADSPPPANPDPLAIFDIANLLNSQSVW
jgi:hypothetical protein